MRTFPYFRTLIHFTALTALLLAGCDTPAGGDADSTGGLDCGQYLDTQSCLAAGCAGMIDTITVPDLGNCWQEYAEPVCVAGGEAVGQGRAFHREIDGATVFARTAECPEALEFAGELAPGEDWSECTGADDDAPGCACLCTNGECPAQVELEAMTACGAELLCPSFNLNEGSPAQLDAAVCFFDALINATPGHLRASGNFGDPQIEIELWIGADGQVRRHDTGSDANCLNCCGTVGPTLDLCTPADQAELQACLEAYLMGTSHPCMDDFDLWFSACEKTAPVCE